MKSKIGNALIILVILICLPVVLPKLFGVGCYNVISGSMEPTISVGSLVYVENVDFDEIQVGDIIAFESGASVITHRVQAVDEANKLFTTKGDANEVVDFSPVAYVDVIGKVATIAPLLGFLFAFISDVVGKAILSFILVIGIALTALDSDKKDSKKNKAFDPRIFLVLGVIGVVGGLGTFLYVYNNYQQSKSLYSSLSAEYVSEAEVEEVKEWYDLVEVDIASLQAINPEVAGWIYIEGTDISYPILYSGDDDKYLHMTMDGKSARAGSIFLEGYNLPDFSDSHSILYGHNMRNLTMFGQLKFYKTDEDFYNQHKYFQIITAEGKYRYEIFSFFDTDAASWVYSVPFSDTPEFGQYVEKLEASSAKKLDISRKITSSDKVVTLSTCSADETRLTVHGFLMDKSE